MSAQDSESQKSEPQGGEPQGGEPRPRRRPSLELIPRYGKKGYQREKVAQRLAWVEEKTGAAMPLVGSSDLPGEHWQGNLENPIGTVQMPLGVAGPLLVDGEHARGTFFVPLATTEGALVRSYERGMVTITRSGGAQTRVHLDENRVSPIFFCDSVGEATDLARRTVEHFEELRAAAESTTRHGKLLRVTPLPAGRRLVIDFSYATGDAHGMNMIVKATDEACRLLVEKLGAPRYYIFSGYNAEKRAAGSILRGGKGKKVTAGVHVQESDLKAVLHLDADEMIELWTQTVVGHLHTGSMGYNGHYANGLTALFIATGQDVANVANSSVGVTCFERTPEGVYASVTLPSLTVATVGGGTSLGTSRECLAMLGCAESERDGTSRSGMNHRGNGALKLAEIAAATLLAGELSMAGAIASGEFVDAHEAFGRNRPDEPSEPTDGDG